MPNVQNCTECESDADELYGDCSQSCPSGALGSSGYNSSSSSSSDFMFYAFSAGKRVLNWSVSW